MKLGDNVYILKIVLQGIGETVMLRFLSKDDAESVRDKINESMKTEDGNYPSPLLVEDDFGLSVGIPPYAVLLIQLIDFLKCMEGDAIWQYSQKRIQDSTTTRLMSQQPAIKRPF